MDDAAKRVLDNIRADRLVELASAICDVHSPTGEEAEVAQLLQRLMKAAGMRARLQEVEPNRPNVIGTLDGGGGGRTLLFNGHMDTSYPFLSGLAASGAMERPLPSEVDGEWLYGTGIDNMKALFACAIVAVEALRDAGVRLNGDIVIAGVVGEIETSPVDRYQGPQYRGHGHGTRHLISHGMLADFCIIGEPSNLQINLGHCGTVWAKITAYGPVTGSYRSNWEDSPIRRAAAIAEALMAWRERFIARYRHAAIEPRVAISAIEGGLPFRAARSAQSCSIYVDVRTVPDQPLMSARDELVEVVRTLDPADERWRSEVEFYASIPGYEIEPDAEIVVALQRAHTGVNGAPAPYSYYHPLDDGSHFGRYGIPTVIYGPGGAARTDGEGPLNECVRIDNLVKCANVYALTALEVCNWPSRYT